MGENRDPAFGGVFEGFDSAYGTSGAPTQAPSPPSGPPSGPAGGLPAGYDEFGPIDEPPSPAAPEQPPVRPRRRRSSRRSRWTKVLVGFLVVVLGLGVAGYVGFERWKGSLDRRIERFGDPFKAIPQTERAAVDPAAGDAVNILLLGSDSRVSAGNPEDWKAGAQRTDAIMMLHIPADRKSAQVISIPRDSWVDIPGHGKNKVNAGFSFGGPTLMVRTIESLTGVRIDHVVIVDFTGFKQITDSLGGVQICVPKTVSDKIGTVQAGCQTMDGKTALEYVRQRKTLPGGDFDRQRRQQNWIRAVLKKLVSSDTARNPFKLNAALEALTSATATDDAFTIDDMQGIALDYKSARADDVEFFRAPLADPPTGYEGKASVVYLDDAQNTLLWDAVRKDKLDAYIATYQPEVLGQTVR